MALDATVGGSSSNSYATVAEADAYFADLLTSAAWTAVSDKSAALVSATRLFELFQFHGEPLTTTQALAFPRVLYPLHDGSAIPNEVKEALFEAALSLAQKAAAASGSTPTREQLRADGVTSLRLGNRSETYAPYDGSSLSAVLQSLPVVAQNGLSRWICHQGKLDSGRHRPGSRLWWPEPLR